MGEDRDPKRGEVKSGIRFKSSFRLGSWSSTLSGTGSVSTRTLAKTSAVEIREYFIPDFSNGRMRKHLTGQQCDCSRTSRLQNDDDLNDATATEGIPLRSGPEGKIIRRSAT